VEAKDLRLFQDPEGMTDRLDESSIDRERLNDSFTVEGRVR
jgi:hypothetical protein